MNINITNPIFHDEAKAQAHLEASRWPDGVVCSHCGSDRVRRMGGKTEAGTFLCNACRHKFNVRTGSILERSHVPLHKWLLATHVIAASKKDISALQLGSMIGVSYRTAWFLCHHIRSAMNEAEGIGPAGCDNAVDGPDENFVGGKAKNRAPQRLL